MTPPDGLSNTGPLRRGYDARVVRQDWVERQAVVEDGLFEEPDVGVCPRCGDPAPECSLCNTCEAEDQS